MKRIVVVGELNVDVIAVGTEGLPVLGQEIWVERGQNAGFGYGPGGKGKFVERERFIYGNGRHGGYGMRGFRNHAGIERILRMAEDLELTEEQQKKLKEMQFDFRMAQIESRAEVEKAEAFVMKLTHDEAPEYEVLEAIDKASKLKGDIRKLQFQHQMSVKSALSEKQWDKLMSCRVDIDGDKEVFMKRRRMRNP